MKTEYFTFKYLKSDKRAQGHYFRDKIINAGLMDKDAFYLWLAHSLNLSRNECHFSRMKSSDILKAINLSVKYLNEATLQRATDYPLYVLISQTDHQIKNNHIPKNGKKD